MENKLKSTVILGGGITGLVASYNEVKKGQKTILLEETNRLGGMISTQDTEWGQVESAANGILNSYNVENLLEELNLEIIPSQPSSRNRYFWNGKVTKLPISFFSAIRGIIGFLFYSSEPIQNENMFSWCERIFGNRFTEFIIEPAFGGIYGSPLEQMDPIMVFSNLKWEKNKSLFSLILKKLKENKKQKPKIKGTISFKGGMEELIKALTNKIQDKAQIKFNQKFSSLESLITSYPNSEIKICTSCSSVWNLIQADKEISKNLSNFHLSSLSFLSLVSITRFSRENIFTKPGFGILFPENSGFKAKGILSNTSIFPNRSKDPSITSETWIYAGDIVNGKSKAEMESIMEEDRKKFLHLSSPAVSTYTYLWDKSFPIYGNDLYNFNLFLENLEESYLEKGFKIQFLGNYRRGIGLRSIIEKVLSN